MALFGNLFGLGGFLPYLLYGGIFIVLAILLSGGTLPTPA